MSDGKLLVALGHIGWHRSERGYDVTQNRDGESMAQGEGEEKSKVEVAGLIPEVYYDLIARVPAGTLLLMFGLGTVLSQTGWSLPVDPKLVAESGISAAIVVTLVAGAGGLLGVLISPVAGIIRSVYWQRCWARSLRRQGGTKAGRCLLQAGWLDTSKHEGTAVITDGTDIHQLDRWLYDYLLLKNPLARSILPKLRAEADLCSYMGACFLIMPIVHLIITISLVTLEGPVPNATKALHEDGTYIWYGLSWSMLVPLCLSGAFRTKRMIMRMIGMLGVLCESEQYQEVENAQQPSRSR